MVRTTLLASSLALLMGSATTVEGHGELVLPKPTYPKWGGSVTATISPTILPFPWAQNYPQAFSDAFDKTGLSLKEFIVKNQDMSGATESGSSPDCGYADPNGTPQPLPDAIQFHTGFIHWGPCEAYCDDVLVAPYTVDCRATYPDGKVPYDKAKCAGKERFTFYWLTMDGSPWQVYVDCVPLQTNGTAAASTAPAATTLQPSTTTTKPSATTIKPAVTTAKPAATTAKPPATTTKPVTTTTKPAATTSAPAVATTAPVTSTPGKVACKRKMRE